MSQYVVWFDSSETGAPVLNNAAGSLIAVLDACLVTGFNTKSITSIIVASGVATATCAGHGFSGTYGKDLLLAGATPTGLNGRKALTYVDTNTFKFDATDISDQTATGTITAKRDSLGWVKEFAGANKAIYKRGDPTATTMMLRVLDTAVAPAGAMDARVFMVESATGIDTYTGQGPTQVQLADGQWINKGPSTAAGKQWSLVGDGKLFFLTTQGAAVLPAANNSAGSFCFGDLVSFKPGDGYHAFMSGANASGSGNISGSSVLGGYTNFAAGTPATACIARGYSQIGHPVGCTFVGISSGVTSGSGNGIPVYPSPIDSGMVINPTTLIAETNATYGHPVRGILPGLCQLLGAFGSSHYTIIEPVVSLPGRKLVVLQWYVSAGYANVALDLTGPWH